MTRPCTAADFDYELPADRIAQWPVEPRDSARLLVLSADGSIQHAAVSDLPRYLRAGDVAVINNSRVVPARVIGRKARGGGAVEVLWVEEDERGGWLALLRARRRPRPGERIELEGGAAAVMLEELADGMVRLAIEGVASVADWLERYGRTPLPPYIRRGDRGAEAPGDRERYQTIYATRPGSVAAPTAGLHFTAALLDKVRRAGVAIAEITLHVGPGTFRPVKVASLDAHRMHAERFEIPPSAADAIAAARAAGGRVLAVGTTAARALETAADDRGRVTPGAGRTDLFIRPPWRFRGVDMLLTNFHLPRSTLLMLVCAFGGREAVLRAYREAIAAGYRFYSYGDCMLLPGPPVWP